MHDTHGGGPGMAHVYVCMYVHWTEGAGGSFLEMVPPPRMAPYGPVWPRMAYMPYIRYLPYRSSLWCIYRNRGEIGKTTATTACPGSLCRVPGRCLDSFCTIGICGGPWEYVNLIFRTCVPDGTFVGPRCCCPGTQGRNLQVAASTYQCRGRLKYLCTVTSSSRFQVVRDERRSCRAEAARVSSWSPSRAGATL
jgi:hypothetical protein